MTVEEAILASGGRIVGSYTVDEFGVRPLGEPGRRKHEAQHSPEWREMMRDKANARAEANRIEGERRREAARARVREVIARHTDGLDETRRILRERAEARKK